MHSRLEQYLKTVEQNLHTLPTEERDNEIREIRMHIESLLEANRELCNTEEEAITQTLAQFGRAQTIGTDLNKARQSGGKPQFGLLVGAVAFNYFGSMLISSITSTFFLYHHSIAAVPGALWYLQGLITTFSISWLTGVVIPRHAVKGAFLAHLLGISISVLFRLLQPSRFGVSAPILSSWAVIPACMIGTALAMFGAKQGAHWRNTRRQNVHLVR